ncbi:MAG: hypothetical protein WDW36_007699 [Sanguina aurantia]
MPSPTMMREQQDQLHHFLPVSMDLLQPGLPQLEQQQHWEDIIFDTVWSVGRAFGFQAFNQASPLSATAAGPVMSLGVNLALVEWVPATIFLVADHLSHLLVRCSMRRLNSCSTEHQRFTAALWQLHSEVFHSYAHRWAPHVGLPPQPQAFTELLKTSAPDDPRVLHGLLSQLSLYFLLHSECVTLRHTPEALCFFFWLALNSTGWLAGQWGSVPAPRTSVGTREAVLAMRNDCQLDLAPLQQALSVPPGGQHPAAGAASLPHILSRLSQGEVVDRLQPPAAAATSSATYSPKGLACLADLVAFGDGGAVCDRLTAPLFHFMAHEMDYMSSIGTDVAYRLGYDDVNESLCSAAIVHSTLAKLGVTRAVARAGAANGGWAAVLALGEVKVRVGSDPSASPADSPSSRCAALGTDGSGSELGTGLTLALPGQTSDAFDIETAAAFWRQQVFIKTYAERRSWLAPFRAFYRVFALQLVLFHIVMAQAFSAYDLSLTSSAVLTHAFLTALERVATYVMTRHPADPLETHRRDADWLQDVPAADPGPAKGSVGPGPGPGPGARACAAGCSPRSLRSRRRTTAFEGAPTFGVLGWLEYVLLFVGLAALYTVRFTDLGGLAAPLQPLAKAYWMLAAGGYTAAYLGHWVLTTRDGYVVSLLSCPRLPYLTQHLSPHACNSSPRPSRFFAAPPPSYVVSLLSCLRLPYLTSHSSRPRPIYWLAGPLGTGWATFFAHGFFWAVVMGLKVAFDLFVLASGLVGPLRVIQLRNWLACSSVHYTIMGMVLPVRCIDGDFILLVARFLPFLLTCLISTSVSYQVTLTLFGMARGLSKLQLGVIGNWGDLVGEFHRAPAKWWEKGVSKVGQGNHTTRVSFTGGYTPAHTLMTHGANTVANSHATANSPSPSPSSSKNSSPGSLTKYVKTAGAGGGLLRSPVPGAAAAAAGGGRSAAGHAEPQRITIIACGLDADEDANSTQHYAKQLTQHGQVSESSGSNCSSPYSYSSVPFTQERTQGPLPYPYELSQAPKGKVSRNCSFLMATPSISEGSVTEKGRVSFSKTDKKEMAAKGKRAEAAAAAAAAAGPGSGSRVLVTAAGATPILTDPRIAPSGCEVSPEEGHLSTWTAFAATWDDIITDLRSGDLVSDREASLLRFARLGEQSVASGLRPLLLPVFAYAGAVQRMLEGGRVTASQSVVLGELRTSYELQGGSIKEARNPWACGDETL